MSKILTPTRTSSTQFEKYEKESLTPLIKVISPFSEMTNTEKYFVHGMVRYFKPKKILEVGVSAGGSSAIFLNAIKDMPESSLISVDYSTNYYKNPRKKSGFIVDDYFPELSQKWKLFTGGDVSNFVDQIGGDIDMVLLDTVHSHPWETLNFLTILPFLKTGSWVIIHDISLYLNGDDAFACKFLFDFVTSENKIRPLTKKVRNIFPNIGAFQITEDTYKYIQDVFMSLALPWRDSIHTVDNKSLSQISSIIKENYSSELLELFNNTVAAQEIYLNNKDKLPLERKIKNSAKMSFTKQYYYLKNSKKMLKES